MKKLIPGILIFCIAIYRLDAGCPATVTITASGDTVLCTGENVMLTASPGVAYLWSTGDSTQSIIAAAQGAYSVTLTDSAGCSGSATKQVILSVPSVQITSQDTFICSSRTLGLTASGPGTSTFVWSSGQTTQIISATQPGIYTVTVTTANGCTAVSPPKTITGVQSVIPSATVVASDATPCAGVEVTFTATITNGGSHPVFSWKKSGTALTNTNINPFITRNSQNGDVYTVQMTSNALCAFPKVVNSPGITMQVTPVTPPLIFVSEPGNVLVSTAEAGNQWYVDDSIINGATEQTLTIDSAGIYTVTVTVNGCSAQSNTLNMTEVGINSPVDNALAIYPNPVQDELSIQIQNVKVQEVRIYTTAGQLVKSIQSEMNRIDVRDLANGFYILEIQFQDASRRMKFEKM